MVKSTAELGRLCVGRLDGRDGEDLPAARYALELMEASVNKGDARELATSSVTVLVTSTSSGAARPGPARRCGSRYLQHRCPGARPRPCASRPGWPGPGSPVPFAAPRRSGWPWPGRQRSRAPRAGRLDEPAPPPAHRFTIIVLRYLFRYLFRYVLTWLAPSNRQSVPGRRTGATKTSQETPNE